MEVDWDGEDASSFMDSLDSGAPVLDTLPLAAAVQVGTSTPGTVGVAPAVIAEAVGAAPPPAVPMKASKGTGAKPTKRARQNAQAQRNYRRREN